jgi:hypothetical protein
MIEDIAPVHWSESVEAIGRFAPSASEEVAAPALHQASGGLSLTGGASPRWNRSSIIRCLAAASAPDLSKPEHISAPQSPSS